MPRKKGPVKSKGPSMSKVAKTYRKTTTKPVTKHEGSRYFNEGAKPYAVGSTERKVAYKPKAMGATFGVDTGNAGGTKRIKRNKI